MLLNQYAVCVINNKIKTCLASYLPVAVYMHMSVTNTECQCTANTQFLVFIIKY